MLRFLSVSLMCKHPTSAAGQTTLESLTLQQGLSAPGSSDNISQGMLPYESYLILDNALNLKLTMNLINFPAQNCLLYCAYETVSVSYSITDFPQISHHTILWSASSFPYFPFQLHNSIEWSRYLICSSLNSHFSSERIKR